MKEINRNIAANIKNYMEVLDINQTELAKRLGCSNTTVSMWIVGDSTPRMDKIDKMCEIFHCNRDDLIGSTTKAPKEILSDQVRALFLERFDRLDDSQRLQLMAFMEHLLKGESNE